MTFHKEIPFTKMHGIGNSYIYLNLFEMSYDEEIFSQLAIDISNVNTGIGSDGLILIHPSHRADVGMRIFNKDGSEGQSCGNGLRCVAHYVYMKGIVSSKNISIETKAGIVHAEVLGNDRCINSIKVDMGKPLLRRSQIPMLGRMDDVVVAESFPLHEHTLEVTALFLGNPNAVFFVDSIEKAPLDELGSLISNDHRFPDRVNVEFVEIVTETELNFRVWERGSGITEACGSGACAAVVASILNGHVERNKDILVHLSGGDLTIRWAENGHVWMTGLAEATVEGIYFWGIN
ncbi:diaminopimelate epimerase [Sporosarcina sp. ACRSL]|uniref:diaminopimelate epimerase n=1 Tax=Sporosarcina sp. ACRSL TaxID=2918215 RepID=UPI001EF5A8C4|nr:diaminopimelate epimerase [Sporosarcina sp. ACRSL]MCG7345401.1 diaminopimelate epimerase [Sporosarcina sp. ACRSL]